MATKRRENSKKWPNCGLFSGSFHKIQSSRHFFCGVLSQPPNRGKDRQWGIQNMRSVRKMTDETQSREVPGHWEGDLIRGAFSGSAIGTLLDRSTRFVTLSKVNDVTAEAVLEGFIQRLRMLPKSLRKRLIYDQGGEIARHEELEKRVHLRVYFADPPPNPWQCPTNENTNDLLR